MQNIDIFPEELYLLFHILQVCATLGTTPSCAFDNALELGTVCKYANERQLIHCISYQSTIDLSIILNLENTEA